MLSTLQHVEPELKEDKGVQGGSCNRRSCQKPQAVWFNHSTRKYYCGHCARMINSANRDEAMKQFGHLLCTIDDDAIEGNT